MPRSNLSDLEIRISQAIVRFEKEFMGRGPMETRTWIIDDLVLVRLKNVLTPAEQQLATADDSERGRGLIKQLRQQLLERGRPILESIVFETLGIPVKSLHTDISTRTGERIIVFTLAQPYEPK